MTKWTFLALTAALLSGCNTHPSASDASINHATPTQFLPSSNPDALQIAYEQRVRARADELYRTKQAGSLNEADKKARAELGDRFLASTPAPDSVYAQRAAKRKEKSAMDRKALDAAAAELSRRRAP
jgi:hypothetical protein